MKTSVVICFALVVGSGIGIFAMKDQINTAIFNPERFSECFRTEVVANQQSNAAITGNALMAMSTNNILGPQLESLGYSLAKGVKRIGVKTTLVRYKQEAAEHTAKFVEYYQSTGKIPEDSINGQIADASVECLERQIVI